MPDDIKQAKPKASSRENLVADHYFGTAEKTFVESALVYDSQVKPYNPDDLFLKTGDYTIYEEMKFDDQVSVAMQLKKDLVIGSGWDIVCEDEAHSEIAKDIYQRLEEDLSCALDDQLEDLIDNAYSFGFALAEKIFRIRKDNTLTLKAIKTRHPASWLIHTDEHGNIERYEQRGLTKDVNVDPKSLIHFVNNPAFQNPYGKSDLRACYDAWFVKRHIIRYYSIFLEKYASPTPIAKYDKSAPADKVSDVFDIIKRFQTKTAMVIPKEFEIQFLEAKGTGDVYINGINLFNMFIGRALTIPDLLGFSGSGSQSGGSQALGREQMDVFLKHIMRRRRTLERVVNHHIVQPLIIWNHGMLEHFPKFQLAPISEDDAVAYAKTFIEAINGKLYVPSDDEINHFRSLIKFPEGEVERHEPSSPLFPGVNVPRGTPPEDEPEVSEQPETEEDVEAKVDEAPMEVGEVIEEGSKKKKIFSAYKVPTGGYSRKVNFQSIKALLDASLSKVMAESKPLIDEIFADLYDQIQKKKILVGPGGKPERIQDLKLRKLKNFQQLLKRNFQELFRDSRLIARNEVPQKNFTDPLATDEFLAFLETETFAYIGDWEYNVTKGARIALQNAIRDGLPLSAVIDIIDEDTKAKSVTSLERFARTKETEVLNRGRLAEFEEIKSVQGYQYSAILDSRTTTICAGLHGKQFVKGTEPVPPMHFNAITEGSLIETSEGLKPVESIQKGDRVLTHANQFQRVYDTMSKFEDKEYLTLELEDGRSLNLTGEHPVLVERKDQLIWIRADELQFSDDVMCLEDLGDIYV